jgi:two-component system response regulator GlrR
MATLDSPITARSRAMNARPHVLVVDDDPDMLIVARAALEHAGYRVTTVQSGKEAVDSLRGERPDAILFDFWMPEMRGDEFVAEVWKACPKPPPLVACSADPDLMDWDARSSGVRHAIAKPFELPELIGTVQKAISGR